MQDTLNERTVVRLLRGIVDSYPDVIAVECGERR